jgi:hypothetical protein
VAFAFAIVACLIAGLASALRGGKYVHLEPSQPADEPADEPVYPGSPVDRGEQQPVRK